MHAGPYKRCVLCGETRPFSDFQRRARARDGYRAACRVCSNDRERERWRKQQQETYVFRAARRALRTAARNARAHRRAQRALRERAERLDQIERLTRDAAASEDAPWRAVVVVRKGKPSDVLVDERDFARFGDLRWSLHGSGYVTAFFPGVGRRGTGVKGAGSAVLLHRAIMGLTKGDGLVVDHINGDPLDNRRRNLRVVTVAENAQNKRGYGRYSQHRGVSWHKDRGRWIAYVRVPGGREVRVSGFASESEAAVAAAALRARHMPYAVER